MKLLLENWRRFLKEASSSEERYFGPNPDNIPCIINLRKALDVPYTVGMKLWSEEEPSRMAPIEGSPYMPMRQVPLIKCLIDAGFNFLGAGSYRATFDVPGHPELILKTTHFSSHDEMERNMRMNKKEAQAYYQTASDLVPKVYAAAKDYLWIISEKVVVINAWDALKEFFPAWLDLVERGIFKESGPEFPDLFGWLIDRNVEDIQSNAYKKAREIVIFALLDKPGTYGWEGPRWSEHGERLTEPIMEKEDEIIINQLINDPMFKMIRDSLAKFDLPSWDIRPGNVGYVIKDGEKQLVIIDPGFELH